LAYAYRTSWAFAQAAEEILAFIERLPQDAEAITKKEKNETIDKVRESLS